jgi:excisionase family DNA binding protein
MKTSPDFNPFSAIDQRFDELTALIRQALLMNGESSPPHDDTPLTVQQAAAFLNLSVPTMYGLVQRSEITYCKRSKRLYFTRADLEAYVLKGRRGGGLEWQESTLKQPRKNHGKAK